LDYDGSDVDIDDHDEDINPDTASIPSASINFAKHYGEREGRRDGWTDKAVYRDAKPHLKMFSVLRTN